MRRSCGKEKGGLGLSRPAIWGCYGGLVHVMLSEDPSHPPARTHVGEAPTAATFQIWYDDTLAALSPFASSSV